MLLDTPLKTIFVFLFLLFLVDNSYGQQFDKKMVQQLIDRSFENRSRIDLDALAVGLTDSLNTIPEIENNPTTPKATARTSANNITQTESAESEIHAAINPSDTNNIIVSAMRLGAPSGGGLGGGLGLEFELTFPIYYTRDFGESWQLSSFNGVNQFDLFTIIAGGGDPVIAFDANGTAYFSFLTFRISILELKIVMEINYAISNDGGANWTLQPEPIATRAVLDFFDIFDFDSENVSQLVDKEWIVCDQSATSSHQNNLYAIYVEIDLVDTAYQIEFRRKLAGNSQFETPILLTTPEIVFAQFSSIDVDQSGTIHVLFNAAKDTDEVLGLFYMQSTDGGESFTEPKRIGDVHIPNISPDQPTSNIVGVDATRMYPCPHLRVDKSGGEHNGNIYITWTANGFEVQNTEGLDIFFLKSTDGGATWSDPYQINDDTDPSSNQFFSNLVVDEAGKVALGWYDQREGEGGAVTNFYMTYSEDGGTTFRKNFAVSTSPADFSTIGDKNGAFGVGEYTQLVAVNNQALPFWADGRTNDGNLDLYFAYVPLDGSEGLVSSLPAINAIATEISIANPFPNPARDVASITLDLQKRSTIKLQLMDQSGRLIKNIGEADYSTGHHLLNIPLAGLPSGNYTLFFQTDFGYFTRPLIVGN